MTATMRIYLPATLHTLAQLRDAGEVAAARAHAVTPALREWYRDADGDELAHVAYTRAAQEALRLLAAAQPATPPRRVVLSADVPARAAGEPLGSSVVHLDAPVPRSAVAAIHVDGSTAATDVASAVAALAAADGGDPDAQLAVSGTQEHELEWYDPSELDELLE